MLWPLRPDVLGRRTLLAWTPATARLTVPSQAPVARKTSFNVLGSYAVDSNSIFHVLLALQGGCMCQLENCCKMCHFCRMLLA